MSRISLLNRAARCVTLRLRGNRLGRSRPGAVFTFRRLPPSPQNVRPLDVEVEDMPETPREHTPDLDAQLEALAGEIASCLLN